MKVKKIFIIGKLKLITRDLPKLIIATNFNQDKIKIGSINENFKPYYTSLEEVHILKKVHNQYELWLVSRVVSYLS